MSATALGARIGDGKEAEVYEYGLHALKLYKDPARKLPAFREAANLALAASFDLPVPIVHGVQQIEGRWGILMDRVEGPSFGATMRHDPKSIQAVLDAMVALHQRVHACPGTRLASLKAKLASQIAQSNGLGEVRRGALLDGLKALRDGSDLCHGDFHPMNILGAAGQEKLVDWLDAHSGPAEADVCRSFVLMTPLDPKLAAAYVDLYASRARMKADQIYAWLPYVAGARLAEGVPDEQDGLLAMVDSGLAQSRS